jgi:lipoate-protein ligase A
MIKNLEVQKAKLKEKVNKEIDNYYTNLENSAKQGDFDINKLEKLMIENERRVKTAFNESNSEVASNVETGVKKTVQGAGTQ